MVKKVWIYSGYVYLCICFKMHADANESRYVSQGREVVEEFYSRFSSREVDLVFVLDRSASVPRTGWESMLNFVRSFLEHFTLNHDNTRIAIISFSTRVSIDINDLEEGRENKCSMMRKIQYRLGQKIMTGYTATNDALVSAKNILLNTRLGAKKAVFVLTDGKSNIGPTPVQASIELRSLRWRSGWNVTAHGPQLEIYAFGIKDAYMPELRSLASPLPNHTYFIPDFRTFEELARSLHDGEQAETWEVVSDRGLCESRCSDNAICTCATRSGQYLCVCLAGYYGNGFVCSECPRGSYKNTLNPHLCVTCPANSTTLLPGATSQDNCVCQPPYHQDAVRKICELRSCPSLPEVPHAHKFNVIGRVKDEVMDTREPCANSPETSCHYNCDAGYRLDNHPGLICNMNGTWTGHVPRCQVVDCNSLDYHGQLIEHGTVTYPNTTTTYLSLVHVTCNEGWRLFGNSTRFCTRHGIWSDTPASCIEAQCTAIRPPIGGAVDPPQCSTTQQMPRTQCTITCRTGYSRRGPSQRTCTMHGTWDTVEETVCDDREPPVITCPADIQTPVTSANYALVHWDAVSPQYSDNSGSDSLQMQIIGVRNSPAQLAVGYHQIKYLVRDQTGNEAFCTQGIHVVEKIVRMDSCPDSMTISDVRGSGQEVSWSEPIFLDNNNRTVSHVCSIPNGSVFPIGTRNVRCAPQDNVPNLPSCVFSVTLERIQCYHPPEPLHGSVTCAQTSLASTTCSVKCNDNYDFFHRPQLMYTCFNGQWQLRQNNTWWPDCSRRMHPRRVSMRSYAEYFYYGGSCEEKKATIAQKFEAWVQRQAWEVCGAASCPLDNVLVSCGVQSRRRRNAVFHSKRVPRNMMKDYLGSDGHYLHISTALESDEIMKGYGKLLRPKRNIFPDKEVPTTTLSVFLEMNYPVVSHEESPGGSVLMHPTVSVMSEHEETYIPEEVLVEESNSGVAEALPDTSVTASVPYVSEIQEETDSPTTERSVSTENPLTTGDSSSPLSSIHHIDSVDLIQETSSAGYNQVKDSSTLNIVESEDEVNSLPPQVSPDLIHEATSESTLGFSQSSSDQTQSPEGPHPSTESTANVNTSQTIQIAFTLSMSSNVSVMNEEEQIEVVNLLYNVVDALDERLLDSRIPLDVNDTSDVLVSAAPLNYEDPQFDACEAGLIAAPEMYQSKSCVFCPVGTYSTNTTCVSCPVGQFQDQEGQMECLQCPANATTVGEGSRNSSDCREPCSEGYSSSTGLTPCTACPRGTYQDVPGSQTCKTCEPEYHTVLEGSTSMEDCQKYCPAGSFGSGGVEPCDLCPLNSYQPQEGEPECLLCPDHKMAANIGAVSEDQCLDYDPCEANTTAPCENGGECVSGDQNGTMCVCPMGYAGLQCETNIQECDSEPCLHGGTCLDGIGNYSCHCPGGYTGSYCELDVDGCLSAPCMNSASCEDLVGVEGYFCHCTGGFTGANCDVVDDCSYFDCHHGDPWNDDGFCRCTCDRGYLGVECHIPIDLCMMFPCENSRKCHAFEDDFECDCLPGYAGKMCSEEINECESDPCQNGAVCFDRINGFYCKCPGGFSGDQCQHEVTPDFDLVFSQTSSTKFVGMEREVIPIMAAVTICFWTRTNQMFGSGTIFSYAVPSHENNGDMVTDFGLSNFGELKLVVSQEKVNTGVTLMPDVWQHVCVTWQGDGGTWDVYVNASQAASGVGLAEGEELVGGGSLVIGQQQSSQGNAYNIWESFVGEITQFNVYDELLPMDQIRILASQSQCDMSYGSVMSWTEVLDSVYGDLEVKNQSHCLDINECMMPDTFPCQPNHICVDIIDGYNCSQCQYGYHGNNCQEPVNECLLGICQNEAACTDGPEPWDFVCHCQTGYMGQYCQDMINYCLSGPCVNQGLCLPRLGGYNCQCQTANTGPNCEDLGTSCSPNPCQNGGICSPLGDAFNCRCPEGYNGTRCENTTRRCQHSPCQNGGACRIQNGHPYCFCDLDWKGHWCEVRVVADCSLSPCLNGGTCEDIPSEVGYLCHCNPEPGVMLDVHCGYASPCQSAPCFKRGVCVTLPNNTYMCDCYAGYSGRQCELDGSVTHLVTSATTQTYSTTGQALCIPATCYNGGTCRPSSGCECSMEYTGSRCQVQKHTVTSHYEGKVTILMPYTTQNKNMVERDFATQMEVALTDLKRTGRLDISLKTLRPSPDKSEMLAEFQMVYTQYVTSLTEKIGFMDVRQILHDAVIAGRLGSLQTSIKGFQFNQDASPVPGASSHDDKMTVYLSVGLVFTMILLVCVSTWVVCKIHRHRKRQQSQSLLPSMNNAANVNLTMLTNPVFDRSDEDQRPRGSLAEENTYAEFGETILPYEVTYATKPNVKECNLARAAARKNSESSFTSMTPSSTKKNKGDNSVIGQEKGDDSPKPCVSRDYITPVVSKNELSQLEDVTKDDKKLLPVLTKPGQANPTADGNDYLEPVAVQAERPQIKSPGYVNVPQGQCDSENQIGAKGEGHSKPEDRLPYLDMQNTTKFKKDEIQFVNEHEDMTSLTLTQRVSPSLLTKKTNSPIDRLAYMINKPARSDPDSTYLEPVPERNPPEYLDICLPKPEELPPPDMTKRKLPPLPKASKK